MIENQEMRFEFQLLSGAFLIQGATSMLPIASLENGYRFLLFGELDFDKHISLCWRVEAVCF